jgi:hypothetical protein
MIEVLRISDLGREFRKGLTRDGRGEGVIIFETTVGNFLVKDCP